MFLEELLLLRQHPKKLRAEERSLGDAVHPSRRERRLYRAVDGPGRVALRYVRQRAEVDRVADLGSAVTSRRTLLFCECGQGCGSSWMLLWIRSCLWWWLWTRV